MKNSSELCIMTDNERTLHGVKKLNEILTLTLTHYIPQGKTLPESYRDTLEVVYEMIWEGKLDHIIKVPLLQPEEIQTKLFGMKEARKLFDKDKKA